MGWWFWIRPYKYQTRSISTSSAENLDKDFNHLSNSSPTLPIKPKTSDFKKTVDDDDNGDMFGTTTNERFARSLTDMLEEDNRTQSYKPISELSNVSSSVTPAIISSPTIGSISSTKSKSPSPLKERRKSIVHFNELVEKIEIPVDVEAATQETTTDTPESQKGEC